MSDTVKRYDPEVGIWGEYIGMKKEEDGDWISYDDYKSTRQALADTKAKLEALEDAIEKSLTNHDPFNARDKFESHNIFIQSTFGEAGFVELYQAIQNSRNRAKEQKNEQRI